ncbi:DUF7507 domain-containing protein, partial [Yoonia sp. 208BN28-4]|uniref:DUF7507 domain-containing protein n=1 Tax=Yoonia sp. 208BN28-4 TaxID=3126505 RepID=UPI00309560BE
MYRTIQKLQSYCVLLLTLAMFAVPLPSGATPFTETVPGTGVALPDEYPGAGGVVIVLTGANGNIYYQFSDPDGAFIGFQFRGSPSRFRGNPFTINDPIGLNCGFRSCADYFGGSLARVDIRFSAYDGDTQGTSATDPRRGFDYNDITLVLNGFDVGNWSNRITDRTNNSGTQSFGLVTGFGNNTFNTGWFSSTNAALLNNILTTESTTTQVRDNDPDDNRWDFTRGDSLPRPDLETVAPGYELEKTVRGGDLTYSAVGDIITYDYVVGNIGSVDIEDVTVVDDIIGPVACSPTELPRTRRGTATEPSRARCSATYTITQDDIDNGTVTNIARANGTPEFGTLGELTDEVTITGPVSMPSISLEKDARSASFSGPLETVTYDFTIANTGNTTLTNVVVIDPKIPGLSCTIAELLPLSVDNTDNTATCTGTYQTTQDDVDRSAAGMPLTNSALVTARDPDNSVVADTATDTITGPDAMPALTIEKTAQVADFDAAGDAIPYRFVVTNTGNVTWPGPPTINDSLGIPVSCPAGAVRVNRSVTCTATYTAGLPDLNAGQVDNSATASITVNGVTATSTPSLATVPAVQNPAFTVVKDLLSGPEPFAATTDQLTYRFTVRNTGNVTLSNVTVTDNKAAPNCPVGDLAPGASLVCTSDPYTILQGDLNAGQVVNTATVAADGPDGNPLTPVTASETVLADQMPAMSIVKTAQEPAIFAANQTVTYTYTVQNTGNVELTDPILIDDDKFDAPFACGSGTLAAGGTRICTADYTITLADALAGFVTNVAFATSGTTQSPTDSVSIPQAGEPELVLVKAVDDANSTGGTGEFNAVGDIVAYTFTITNVGGRTISAGEPISIADALIDNNAPAGGVDCSAQPSPTLFSTQDPQGPTSFVCTGTYQVRQADINRGFIDNTATASYTFSRNGVPTLYTSPEASTRVLTNVVPDFTLAKSPDSPTFTGANQPVTFTFTATNTSEQRIATVTVTDPAIPGFSCTISGLRPARFPPENVGSCTGVYTTTQDDMDRGTFTNTASATGVGQTGITIPERTAQATITRPVSAINRAMTMTKTPSQATYALDDQITYTFGVTNTGNVTLTNVLVTDTDLGTTCTIPSIAPGITDRSCTAQLTVDQALIDAGSFTNNAVATATDTPNAPATAMVTGPTRNPRIVLEKVADAPFTAKDDVVSFTLTARNTGNVTLTGVTITDDFFDPDLTCNIGTLAPGTSDSCTANYTIIQDDVDAGVITNTADVTASGGGQTIMQSATEVVNGPAEMPGVRIEKFDGAPVGTFGAKDSIETYNLLVTNTGNVTLENLRVVDAMIGLDCTINSLLPGFGTTQCDVPTQNLSGTYTVQQADIDAGGLMNTATVSAETTRNTPVTDTVSLTLNGPEQLPALGIAKTATSGANYTAVGDEITYQYIVTNTGNITITAPISVEDDKTTVSCVQAPGLRLEPTEFITCTATYAVTQPDLDDVDDDGGVANVAFAEVAQSVITGTTNPATPVIVRSATDTVIVPADQRPGLGLVKSVTSGTMGTYDDTSDVISYTFVVTNTGNVTTTAPVFVDDPAVGAPFECAAAGLAPGASASCTGTWSPEQGDIDRGSFENTADAATVFDGTTVTSPEDSVVVNAVQLPALETVKSFVSLVPNVFSDPNVVTYRFDVENTGNQTAVGPIEIVDSLTGRFVCDPGDLAPGTAISCTGTYTITADDVRLGSLTNVAFATSPTVDSPPASETIPDNVDPALSITKTADVATFAAVGDPIVYTYTVRNTSTGGGGSAPPAFASDIFIVDDKFLNPDGSIDAIECYMTARDSLPSLQPVSSGALPNEVTCQATYLVTQDDLDAVAAGLDDGFVTNNATGETVFGTTLVVSPPQSVTVVGEALPALSVDKTVSGPRDPDPAQVDDVLDYTIVTTNTGNQTVSGVVVTDPRIPVLACTVGGNPAPSNIVLAPGDAVTCTGTYTVLQSDIDAQVLGNTATAMGTNPQGEDVTGTGTADQDVVADAPLVDVVKTLRNPPVAGQPAFTDPGQQLVFDIAVTNTGNVTLTSSTVTDILLPGDTRTIGTLLPGETDRSVAFTYEVQQSDIDRGFILNEATAVAVPGTPAGAGGATVQDSDTIRNAGPARAPGIALAKSVDEVDGAAPVFDAEGQTISYTYTLLNTGNITITATPDVTDDKIATVVCDALPAGGLLPTGELTCRGTYAVTQADVDRGFVTNLADATVANPLGGAPLVAPQASATVNSDRRTSLTLDKMASVSSGVQVDDLITYTYVVTNTGTVTLDNVTVIDQQTTAAGTGPLALSDGGVIATLAPGGTQNLTATYRVTQADIDLNITLTNEATVTGTPRFGLTPPAPQTDDASVTPVAPAPALVAIKDVVLPADLVPNAEIVFPVTVTNTGNVTLRAPVLTDTLTRLDTTVVTPAPTAQFLSGDTGDDSLLSVGEVWTYEVRYALTQDDIDAGGISNSIRAATTDLLDTPVFDISDNGVDPATTDTPTVVQVTPAPAIEAEKVITSTTAAVTDTVRFEIRVTNTGNVTLDAVAIASDVLTRNDTAATPLTLASGPAFFAATDGSPAGTLQVGETATYRASYVLTQDDIDAGGITNTATATGTPPTGSPVTDISDNANDTDGNTTNDPTELVIDQMPGINAEKVITSTGAALNDRVAFEIRVTNTGDVTLNNVAIQSDTLTRADAANTPLSLSSGPTFGRADQGSVAGTLKVGETATYTASYVLQQEDIDAGGIANIATAVGTPPDGTPITDVTDNGDDTDGNTENDPTTLTTPQAPAINAEKVITSSTVTVNEAVTFDIRVTNTGDVTLTDVAIQSDTLTRADAGNTPLSLTSGPTFSRATLGSSNGTLQVGETATYTVSYVLQQEDIDAGGIANTATAVGTPPDGTPITDVTDNGDDGDGNTVNDPTTLDITPTPSITLAKSLLRGGPSFTVATDVLTYQFLVTNTGNVTITEPVVIDDPLITNAGGTIICQPGPLAPMGTLMCEGDYAVTQDDVDAGSRANSATAATSFEGIPAISGRSGIIVPGPAEMPSVTLTKTDTDGSGTFGALRSIENFSLTVENDGNVTLENLRVVDAMIGLDCTIDSLLPGVTTSTCDAPAGPIAGSYEITQPDIDRGTLTNMATVSGQTTLNTPVGDDVEITLTGPEQLPTLSIAKSATGGQDFFAVRDIISYQYIVSNTGNITITAPISVADDKAPVFCTQAIGGRLAPDATITCTAEYRVTQDDLDTGNVVNTASASVTQPVVPGPTYPGGIANVTSPDDVVSVPADQRPGLGLVKSVTSGTMGTYDDTSDVISYTFVVTNTGN